MKASELIIALQILIEKGMNFPVTFDTDFGLMEVEELIAVNTNTAFEDKEQDLIMLI